MSNVKCWSYSEKEIKKSKIKIKNGYELLNLLLSGRVKA
jgi:hypothetical protein